MTLRRQQKHQHLSSFLLGLAVVVLWNGSTKAQSPSRIYSYQLFADGANLSLIADENTMPGREFLGAPVASHDGNWVLFDATKGQAFSKTRLIKIAVAGPDKGKVVDLGYGVCATFSPDDKQISFFLNNNCPSGEERGVWIMNADGSGRERLGQGVHPKWSPDGSAILAVNRFRSPRYLTTINLKTRKQTRLLKNEVVLGQPAWSPDGKRFAVTVKDGDDRVLCVFKPEAESSGRQELWRNAWNDDYEETWPDWSADGGSIVFTFWNIDDRNSYAMTVSPKPGADAAKLGFVPPGADVRDCCWSADGKRVLFASRSESIHERATTPSE